MELDDFELEWDGGEPLYPVLLFGVRPLEHLCSIALYEMEGICTPQEPKYERLDTLLRIMADYISGVKSALTRLDKSCWRQYSEFKREKGAEQSEMAEAKGRS